METDLFKENSLCGSIDFYTEKIAFLTVSLSEAGSVLLVRSEESSVSSGDRMAIVKLDAVFDKRAGAGVPGKVWIKEQGPSDQSKLFAEFQDPHTRDSPAFNLQRTTLRNATG